MWAGERNTPEGWDVLTSSTVLFQPQRWQCPKARPRGSGRQTDRWMPGETGLDISYSGLPGLSSQAEGDRPLSTGHRETAPGSPRPDSQAGTVSVRPPPIHTAVRTGPGSSPHLSSAVEGSLARVGQAQGQLRPALPSAWIPGEAR